MKSAYRVSLLTLTKSISCISYALSSAVFYQDQSKRKETRMILFFVCVKCNHSFTDPTLPNDSRPDTEDG